MVFQSVEKLELMKVNEKAALKVLKKVAVRVAWKVESMVSV